MLARCLLWFGGLGDLFLDGGVCELVCFYLVSSVAAVGSLG